MKGIKKKHESKLPKIERRPADFMQADEQRQASEPIERNRRQ